MSATPTIVLVHGAFADAASWGPVTAALLEQGHAVRVPPVYNRSLVEDAASIRAFVEQIDGPVLLAGHSYGGAVITNVDRDAGDIVGLVYIASFAPEAGESANQLAARFPGSSLADAVKPIPRSDGSTDLYIDRDRFHDQFAADLPVWQTTRMAATQRPVALAALEEPSGDRPLWKEVPSWFLIADEDRNIPPALQRFLAERAGARRTVEIPGASHAVAASHPDATADLILEAAALHVAA